MTQEMLEYVKRWVHTRVQANLSALYSSLNWMDGKEIPQWVDKAEIIRSVEASIVEVTAFNIEDNPPSTPSSLDHQLNDLYGDAYISTMRTYWDGDFPALPPDLAVMANSLVIALKSKHATDAFRQLVEEWKTASLSLNVQQILGHDVIREAFIAGMHDHFPSPENISGTLAVSESLFQQKEEAWMHVIEQATRLNFDPGQSFG